MWCDTTEAANAIFERQERASLITMTELVPYSDAKNLPIDGSDHVPIL